MRFAFSLVGIALLASGIYAAAVRGLADTDYSPARLAMERWAKRGNPPAPQEWTAAEKRLEAALAREPGNPLYVEELGRLYELRALSPAAAARSGEQQELLQRALGQFRHASRLRPGSPFAWASIALLKFRLDEPDYEFYGALDRAERFGPWEPGVQRILADIGFAAWPWLAERGKEVVAGAVERGLVSQGEEIRRIANHYKKLGQLDAFCSHPVARARHFAVLCGDS